MEKKKFLSAALSFFLSCAPLQTMCAQEKNGGGKNNEGMQESLLQQYIEDFRIHEMQQLFVNILHQCGVHISSSEISECFTKHIGNTYRALCTDARKKKKVEYSQKIHAVVFSRDHQFSACTLDGKSLGKKERKRKATPSSLPTCFPPNCSQTLSSPKE